MNRTSGRAKAALAASTLTLLLTAVLLAACGNGESTTATSNNVGEASSSQGGITDPATVSSDPVTDSGNPDEAVSSDGTSGASPSANTGITDPGTSTESPPVSGTGGGSPPASGEAQPDQAVATDPDSIAVLVNKQLGLPKDYEPKDLVYPDVTFTFKEKIEKRMMRKEAAEALEEMFAGAKKDGIYLAGVSGYRSYARQKALFESYVKKDGEEKAKTYSAVPGYSEHETGLAIDVSGSDGKCAAEDCFADTEEAAWIAKHAHEYGFIVRFPKGKEDITGYKYEAWHIRFVGKEIAKDIAERGITLEEYYNAIPVSK
ncbi:M15 family metallopeptidase [Paenibacillus caui]|uniref:M15 family metallopeptidase n=1 Tax=Paenibacillus caui TaxID=2873927 RepID=UPI001CA89BFE|nr:M15 family metallopeptidase [Paenibacillus caui]